MNWQLAEIKTNSMLFKIKGRLIWVKPSPTVADQDDKQKAIDTGFYSNVTDPDSLRPYAFPHWAIRKMPMYREEVRILTLAEFIDMTDDEILAVAQQSA